MNTVVTELEAWPRRLHTKIVGTTFEGRQSLLTECKRQGIADIRLVRDPSNRYDPFAIAVEADLNQEDGGIKSVQLGFLSNSEHFCADCGAIVGNALFHNSRKIRCRECGMVFKLGQDNSHTACPNPSCRTAVEVASSKVVICPRCGGVDFGRGGLATRISRAMASGVEYRASVTEYTGGDGYAGGQQQRSMGCNVLIERIETNERTTGGDTDGAGT